MDIIKKETFEKKLIDIMNYGALNLAMALGYKHGLFEAMEEFDEAVSCSVLAQKTGVNERYVKEWLGIMCTGNIIEITKDENGDNIYNLPPEHALFLTKKHGDSNMCVYTQELPLLTESVMARVSEDFTSGNGVPFSAYPKFQEFMAELSHAKHKNVLIQKFLPGVDNGTLIKRLKTGIRVCDIGCGQGVALHLMAKHFPNSSFVGIDNHKEAIETAKDQSKKQLLYNVEFILQDAATIKDKEDFTKRFDYIFAFDSIHDQTKPLDSLQGIKHMLAPGGFFSMIDIDASSDHAGNMEHPMGPFLYTVSLMHCMPVGLWDNGAGLGMMWGREQALTLLKKAGFENIEALDMDHDPFNVHYLCRV